MYLPIWYIYNCKTELVYKKVLKYNLERHFILKLQWIALHKISCFSDILIRLWILICISSVYNLLRPIIQLLYIQMNIELIRSWSKVNQNENLHPIKRAYSVTIVLGECTNKTSRFYQFHRWTRLWTNKNRSF